MEPEEYKNLVLYKLKGEYPVLLTKKEKFLLRRKAALYDIEGEQLFYWRYKGTAKTIKTKVVCGAEEANTLFLDFHASPIGAHCGQTKTREAISKRFYWPGMSVDINNWVSQCAVCQASAATIKKPAVYIPIKVSQPFELVGMDLIGKLKETKSGNQYICVFIDYFTKWPQAYPLKTKSAKEVTSCLIKFVHQFEAPKRILTDQGKEFVNSLNKRVCDMLNIKRSLCSPYHPQTNGLVERMNGIIQRALCKVVGDHPETWDDYLDAVMFGLRTKKQMTTKYSPYYLMFGREARYPSEIPEHYVVDESVEDIAGQEDLSQDMLKHEKLLEVVKDNVFKAQENTKVKIQSTKKKIDFKVGDRVLRANIRSQQRKGGKLEPNFLGPYTITAIQDKSADLQDANGAIIPKVNIDQLKLSKNTISRVPHWGLKKQAQASVASLSSPSLQPAAQLLPAQPAITPPQQGPAAPSATRPTATAAPQATAATGSATASKTTASPPPPPPITAPDATVSPVTTPQPSQGQQATVPAVSDPGPGVTALQEDTPPASAPNTSAPAHASAPQATSPTSEPASETAAPNTASQAAAPDLASQATSSDPASQTAASDPALQATVPDPAPAPKAAESTASAPNTTAPAHATAAQATSTTAPEPASQTVAPDPASQATGPDPVPSQKDKAPTAPDLNLKASAPPHATAPPATAPTAPASDPQTTAPQASAPHATAPPATAPTAPASDPQTTAPQASAPQATAPTGSTTHQQSTAPSAASRPHRYTQAVAEKCIMDAWSGKNPHVLLSKIGAYKLFYWDITQTGPDMELESESINAYLAIMVRECNHQNSAKAAFIDSFAMTAVWNRKNTRLKIKPMEHEVIVGIVNEHHHWTLVVIYPQEKKSLYLDPLGETKQGIQKCLESTRAFMRKKGCNVSRWTCDTVKHPKQMDATSCGVFALKFAEKILRKESVDFPSTKKAINAHRLQIATILLLETDDLTNLCHFCGKEEHDTDFDWIQCDLCLRWFHQYCVNSPPPEESFICLACK